MLLLSTLGCAGSTALQPASTAPVLAGAVVATSAPPVWFEGHLTPARISPRGDRALLGEMRTGDLRLLDLSTGRETPLHPSDLDVDAILHSTFTHDGRIAVSATVGDMRGWFVEGSRTPLDIPPDALPTWSPRGDRIAFFHRSVADSVVIATAPARRAVYVPGIILSVAWSPDGSWLLALAGAAGGGSTLYRIPAADGPAHPVVSDLDAAMQTFGTFRPIAVSDDGSHAYVALASERTPPREARHRPIADRYLDIYEVELATGARRRIAATSGDDFGPAVVGDWLYWSAHATAMASVVLPFDGGPAHTVVADAMLPTWRQPYGGVDWSPDGATIVYPAIVDGRMQLHAVPASGGAARVISSDAANLFHPTVSPDGRWIAATRMRHTRALHRMRLGTARER